MFSRHPDKFPLFQIETSTRGRRVVVGPCAVTLIVRLIATLVAAGLLIIYGTSMAGEFVTLLKALGL